MNFINGSLNWSDEDFFNAEDIIFNNFEYKELNKLGIELGLIDMREKGGECFIELYFDLSSIEDFEISSISSLLYNLPFFIKYSFRSCF